MKRSLKKATAASHNLGSIGLSILLAIFVAKIGIVRELLLGSEQVEIIGSFIGGLFFTSVFTTAPAMVVIYELAQGWSPWMVAAIGACGAVAGDLILFQFFKERLVVDGRTKWGHILHLSKVKFLAAAVGAIIIASPLPDELGLALMGVSKVRARWIVPLTFVFNFLGILAIGLLAKSR